MSKSSVSRKELDSIRKELDDTKQNLRRLEESNLFEVETLRNELSKKECEVKHVQKLLDKKSAAYLELGNNVKAIMQENDKTYITLIELQRERENANLE